jgi:hypothetical protein
MVKDSSTVMPLDPLIQLSAVYRGLKKIWKIKELNGS